MDRYSTLAAEELERAGRRAHVWDLVGRPVWTFLRMFLLQRGWRDGWAGLVVSGLYAASTFGKYAKLWERTRTGRHG
jgi:(heptosyl)LPS beta-1,4-glucosyltransferase